MANENEQGAESAATFSSEDCLVEIKPDEEQSFRFYEELFCTGRSFLPLVPLTGVFIGTTGPQSDVTKQGYLGKLERNHKRYFVLRAGSHTGPSRLEWFKSQEKFAAMEKSAGKTGKQGTIYLRCCLGVSRIGNSRKAHTVALYANDQTLILVMEDRRQQNDWYAAIKQLMVEEQKYEEHGDGADDDDGYCTLPPAAFFKEVWPVVVKPKGLGCSKPLTGENRLCLTRTSLVLVRLGAGSDLPSVTIPLLSVRRFGHLDGLFFLEVGRSAPNGPGEIWMEAKEQGNPALAQQIHEVVRETVQALRALPDFTRSQNPSQAQPPALLASKRRRPKCKNNLANARALCPLVSQPRSPDVHSSPEKQQLDPHKADEMNTSLGFPCGADGGTESCDEERRGYMLMSPVSSHSSSWLSQEDYVTMESPQKANRPAYSSTSSFSSLQTSFSSANCDDASPPNLSLYETEAKTQADDSSGCSPQDETEEELKSALSITPFILSEACHRKPQLSDVKRSNEAQQIPESSADRRYRLCVCLFACLQSGAGS